MPTADILQAKNCLCRSRKRPGTNKGRSAKKRSCRRAAFVGFKTMVAMDWVKTGFSVPIDFDQFS